LCLNQPDGGAMTRSLSKEDIASFNHSWSHKLDLLIQKSGFVEGPACFSQTELWKAFQIALIG